jgi:hypothetical protein
VRKVFQKMALAPDQLPVNIILGEGESAVSKSSAKLLILNMNMAHHQKVLL